MTAVMGEAAEKYAEAMMLQWVRGPMTAVMCLHASALSRARRASMGPRSDDRGYGDLRRNREAARAASMGPRSDDRGYAPARWSRMHRRRGFNGSAVR